MACILSEYFMAMLLEHNLLLHIIQINVHTSEVCISGTSLVGCCMRMSQELAFSIQQQQQTYNTIAATFTPLLQLLTCNM
eukprot:8473-Heterococcus_DN1.PRE.4